MIAAQAPSRPLVIFDRYPPDLKRKGPHIDCAQIASILGACGAELPLDPMVELAAKEARTNHEALLKVHHGDSLIISFINRF
jgi:hypothetical protein